MIRKLIKAAALLLILVAILPPFGFTLQAALHAFFIIVAAFALWSLADSAVRGLRSYRNLKGDSE